jgi:hypothetical protein
MPGRISRQNLVPERMSHRDRDSGRGSTSRMRLRENSTPLGARRTRQAVALRTGGVREQTHRLSFPSRIPGAKARFLLITGMGGSGVRGLRPLATARRRRRRPLPAPVQGPGAAWQVLAEQSLALGTARGPTRIFGPYPNPARAGGVIPYASSRGGKVRLTVHEVSGREVARLRGVAAARVGAVDLAGGGRARSRASGRSVRCSARDGARRASAQARTHGVSAQQGVRQP